MTLIRLLFSPDFGGDAGYGHLTRSLTLAEKFIKHDHYVAFVFNKNVEIPRNVINFFDVFTVDDVDTSAHINKIIEVSLIDVLVIDSYKWNHESQFFDLSAKCTKVLFDDFCLPLPADIIINACPTTFYSKRTSSDKIYLLGSKFQMLKKDIIEIGASTFQPSINKISVLMGGSDLFKMTEKWILFFENFFRAHGTMFEVDIFCGHQESHKNFKSPSIKVYKSPANFLTLVSNSQLAISAGGQMLYELIAMGIPTLGYELGPDQRANLLALSSQGLIINLGDSSSSEFFCMVEKCLLSILDDENFRREMRKKQLIFLDHLGVDRIFKRIEDYQNLKQSN